MGTRDPRVDAYIARSADFAKPVLISLRETVHAACPDVEVPKELSAALKKNPNARATFEAFSPSHRREYAAWIAEAKREETRQRRVEAAVAQLAEGKTRNWKYERRTGR